MHPKVEVTQVEDAASAAASGSSENDSNDLQNDFSVMVIGILTGGFLAFSLLAFVGFMARRCVSQQRNGPAMMCNNLGHPNGSLEAISNSSGQTKTILQQQVHNYVLSVLPEVWKFYSALNLSKESFLKRSIKSWPKNLMITISTLDTDSLQYIINCLCILEY